MVTKEVLALPPIVSVQAVIEVLENSRFGIIPISWDTEAAAKGGDTGFRIEGVITVQTLLKMVKHRIGFWVRPWMQGCRVYVKPSSSY